MLGNAPTVVMDDRLRKQRLQLAYVPGPLDSNAAYVTLMEVMPAAESLNVGLSKDAFRKEEATCTYEEDFYAWTQDQAACLRNLTDAEADSLGLDNTYLAEEIEDLGKSELRGLKSQIERAAMHLLKWKYQKSARHRGWKGSITEARFRIAEYFESVSLRNKITNEVMEDIFCRAHRLAIIDTGLTYSDIPTGVIFSLDEVEDHDFFPEPD